MKNGNPDCAAAAREFRTLRVRPLSLFPLSAAAPAHRAQTQFAVTPKRKRHRPRRTAQQSPPVCPVEMPDSLREPRRASDSERRSLRECVCGWVSVKILRYFTSAWTRNTIIHQLRRSNAMSAVEESKIAVPSVQVCIQHLKE